MWGQPSYKPEEPHWKGSHRQIPLGKENCSPAVYLSSPHRCRGIIVGLAAQSALTDIITSIVVLIDRPFRIGDRIRIEKLDTWGI
jgi:hypothetical protein